MSEEMYADQVDNAPKKRGRKPSALAKAGRDYDDALRKVQNLSDRRSRYLDKAEEIEELIEQAQALADEAKVVLDKALNG